MILIGGASSLHAADDPTIKTMAVLADETGSMTEKQAVASSAWEALPGSRYGAGYGTAALWFRLSIVSRNDGIAVLSIRPSFLDDVTFFLPASTAIRPGQEVIDDFVVYRQGDRQPLSNRLYGVRGFAVPIALKGAVIQTVYVRLQTTSTRLFSANLTWAPTFISNVARESLFGGASYVVICGMMVFAGVQWLRTRSRVYAAHIGLSVAVFLFYFSRNGDFSIMFSGTPILPDRMVGISVCLALGTLVLFVAQTLPMRAGLAFGRVPARIFIAVVVAATGLAISGLYQIIAGPFAVLIIASIVYLLVLSLAARDGALGLRIARSVTLALFLPTGFVNLGLIDFYWQAETLLDLGTIGLLVVIVAIAWREDARRRNDYIAAIAEARMARTEATLKEQSMAVHKQWVSIFSHEIKTPLSIIDSSRANIAKIDGSREIVERTNKIHRAVEAIDGLVGTMLAVEELEARIDAAVDQPIDMRALIRSCLHDISSLNATVTCPPSLQLEADPTLIRIAVSSLIVNSHKHGSPGGQVRIIADRTSAHGVLVQVLSEGPELAPELLPHLFEKHFRASGSPGHGIGLWATAAIAKRYGGQVNYARDDGSENMFMVTFRGDPR